MRNVMQLLVSAIFGLCGGLVATIISPRFQSSVPPRDVTAKTVRAERFELLNPSNHVIAYWGRDWKTGQILLSFLDEKDRQRAQFGVAPMQRFDSSFSPFEVLLGADGRVRLQQVLDSSDRPVLTMGDAASENRLLLGHWPTADMPVDDKDHWDKWSLAFPDLRNGGDSLDLGASTPLNSNGRAGYVRLKDTAGRVREAFPK